MAFKTGDVVVYRDNLHKVVGNGEPPSTNLVIRGMAFGDLREVNVKDVTAAYGVGDTIRIYRIGGYHNTRVRQISVDGQYQTVDGYIRSHTGVGAPLPSANGSIVRTAKTHWVVLGGLWYKIVDGRRSGSGISSAAVDLTAVDVTADKVPLADGTVLVTALGDRLKIKDGEVMCRCGLNHSSGRGYATRVLESDVKTLEFVENIEEPLNVGALVEDRDGYAYRRQADGGWFCIGRFVTSSGSAVLLSRSALRTDRGYADTWEYLTGTFGPVKAARVTADHTKNLAGWYRIPGGAYLRVEAPNKIRSHGWTGGAALSMIYDFAELINTNPAIHPVNEPEAAKAPTTTAVQVQVGTVGKNESGLGVAIKGTSGPEVRVARRAFTDDSTYLMVGSSSATLDRQQSRQLAAELLVLTGDNTTTGGR